MAMKLSWIIGRLCLRILQKNQQGDGSTGVWWNRTSSLLSKYRVVALANLWNDSVRTILVTPEINNSFQTQFIIPYLIVVLPVNLTPITFLAIEFSAPAPFCRLYYTASPYLQSNKHIVIGSSYPEPCFVFWKKAKTLPNNFFKNVQKIFLHYIEKVTASPALTL